MNKEGTFPLKKAMFCSMEVRYAGGPSLYVRNKAHVYHAYWVWGTVTCRLLQGIGEMLLSNDIVFLNCWAVKSVPWNSLLTVPFCLFVCYRTRADTAMSLRQARQKS